MLDTYKIGLEWFDALCSGDHDRLYKYIDEDVVWINSERIEGVNDVIPWIGEYRGKKTVIETFKWVEEYTTPELFELLEMNADGKLLYAKVHERQIVKSTNLPYDILVMFRMKIKNGKVVHWQAFWDTALAVNAFKGINQNNAVDAVKKKI